ncbi:MAG: hypothetical protein PHT33_10085 [bacterium]|nr:hypothetical protein [bacterium]
MKNQVVYVVVGICLAILVYVSAAVAAEAGKRAYGEAVYPVPGNMLSAEGTVELWYKFMPDIEDMDRNKNFFRWMVFRVESDASGLLFFIDKGMKPRTSLSFMGKGFFPAAIPPMSQKAFQPGEWRHFAYTWQGRNTRLLFDGVVMDDVNNSIALTDIMATKGRVVLGYGKSAVIYDDLCISSRVRTPEEIRERMKSSLKADVDTMLLDNFDEDFIPDGMRETTAAYISGWSGERGARVGKSCRFVDGKYGKGLATFTD